VQKTRQLVGFVSPAQVFEFIIMACAALVAKMEFADEQP